MSSTELIKLLKREGWQRHAQKGSHVQFVHPARKGKVTVPHPRKDIPVGTWRAILKQAGLL